MISKYKKDFNSTMKRNFQKGLKKGKGEFPRVTCGAFGKCKFLKKREEKK